MAETTPNKQLERAALSMAVLGSFLTPFMSSAINIALPDISREFKMNAVALSWVATIYLLAAAMFLIPFGKLSDIKGRKRIYTIGMIIYTIASTMCALAFSGWFLLLARLLQGFAGSMIFSTAVAILSSVFPPHKRGRALGLAVASVYIGLAAGPFIGGLLTHALGWRSIFWINIPFGIGVLFIVFKKLKGEWAEARGEKFDLTGAVFYALSIVAIMYGLSLLPDIKGLFFLLPGFSLLVIFIIWERKTDHPILNMDLFATNRVFALSNLAAFINYSATFAVGFLLSLYLQVVKGLNPRDAGVILVAQPIVMAIFSPIAGRLSDRLESRLLATLGMALTTIGLVMIIFFKIDTLTSFIIITLVTVGFGFALFSSPNTNAVMGSVEKKFYGVASATLGAMRLTGQMFSMGIAMLIINIFIGKVALTPAISESFVISMRTTFIIFAILCFLGIFASIARGKTHQSGQ